MRWRKFLGKRVCVLWSIGVVNALALFLSELALTAGIQSFLIAMGLLNLRTRFELIARFSSSWKTASAVLMCIVLARAIFLGLQIGLQGWIADAFRERIENRLVDTVFSSSSFPAAEAASIFGERRERGAAGLQALQSFSSFVILFVLCSGGLLYLDSRLTVFLFGIAVLAAWPVHRLARRFRVVGDNLARGSGAAGTRILSSIRNLPMIRIHRLGPQEAQAAKTQLRQVHVELRRFWVLMGMNIAAPQVIGMASICAILGWSRMHGKVEAAHLLAYFYLTLRLFQYASAVMLNGSEFLLFRATLMGLLEWWESSTVSNEERDRKDAVYAHGSHLRIEKAVGWEARSVTCRRPGSLEPIFESLTFKIRPGEAFVITGPSGSGKTTLLEALLGLRPLDGGELVLVSPEKLPGNLDASHGALLNRVAYVGPEPFLIAGTVRENLLYGNGPQVSDAAIREALLMAECEFLLESVSSLNRVLTEQGQGLSAGQKQRLSLARALLRNPLVLVLDEASANLDFDSERRLVTNLSRLKGRVTLLIATHRDEWLRIADSRIVLKASELDESVEVAS